MSIRPYRRGGERAAHSLVPYSFRLRNNAASWLIHEGYDLVKLVKYVSEESTRPIDTYSSYQNVPPEARFRFYVDTNHTSAKKRALGAPYLF